MAGDTMGIGTDASPWGLGGWIAINGSIRYHFSSQISADDATRFQHAIGDHEGQQVWGNLAILVAIRSWCDKFSTKRIRLLIREDHIRALTLTFKLRSRWAKALSLDPLYAPRFGHFEHPPQIAFSMFSDFECHLSYNNYDYFAKTRQAFYKFQVLFLLLAYVGHF